MTDIFSTPQPSMVLETPKGLLDDLIGEHTIGGPLDPRDTRMILHRKDLEHLIEVSKSSLSGTVVLHNVGFRVKTWRTREGHQYQTVTLIATSPRPGPAPLGGER